MVRRAIEGFCADQGVTQSTLHRSLQELTQRNVIDARLLEWADSLRVLGNAGAHFTGQVTEQDVSDALDLIEAMLDYVAYAKVSLKKYRPIAARNEESNVSRGLL
jgi:hypothetical protein